jgi:uncharacterized membrane protein
MKTNNHWFRTAFLAVIVLALGTASQTWGVSYTAIDLCPIEWDESYAYGTNGTQQVGRGGSHAILWYGTAASSIDLNPSGFYYSEAWGTNGAQQVGRGNVTGPPATEHALLWSGSAENYVDLHPSGFDWSYAYGISGTQQVGQGNSHALLWNGTAASCIDLNPSGFVNSFARGTNGTKQVGYGCRTGDIYNHALLWNGSAASCVDLHPSGFGNSEAYGISGTQQVGYAAMLWGGYPQAVLWNGTAASCVNLNPSGFYFSEAYGTNGKQQVGRGYTLGSNEHALVWSGSADSYIDLHQFMPAVGNWTSSCAYGIDSNGNIVGSAFDYHGGGIERRNHAILWKPVAVCSEPIPADLNGDCKIDFTDFCLFAVGWPDEEDLTGLAALCASWLDCNLDPPEACWY